jgi:hypothetical protein
MDVINNEQFQQKSSNKYSTFSHLSAWLLVDPAIVDKENDW